MKHIKTALALLLAAFLALGLFSGCGTEPAVESPAPPPSEAAEEPPAGEIPIVHSRENICRVTCQCPGIYVPEDRIGTRVEQGAVLGAVIDALNGVIREEVRAPFGGLVFSQRSYSAVYPGTLIARIRKEQA